jgi:hypothetical protein
VPQSCSWFRGCPVSPFGVLDVVRAPRSLNNRNRCFITVCILSSVNQPRPTRLASSGRTMTGTWRNTDGATPFTEESTETHRPFCSIFRESPPKPPMKLGGGEGRNRTDECSFCRAVPYHLATPPSVAANNMEVLTCRKGKLIAAGFYTSASVWAKLRTVHNFAWFRAVGSLADPSRIIPP